MTVPLPRERITALLAAAHAATPAQAAGADPYLQKRLDDAATIARWEERIRRAAIHAFGRWTLLTRNAILDGTRQALTADPLPGDPQPGEVSTRALLPPDPNAMAGLGPAWDQIAQASIVTSVGDLLGETFGQYLLDADGVISSRAWSESYLAGVSNRLSGIPDQTFDRVRTELQAGHDAGESIPSLRDRVAAMLSTRQGGDANFWRQRANTIARTETTGALNGGHLAAWRAMAKAKVRAAGDDLLDGGEAGSDETAQGSKIWVSTMDERTRPSHVLADGQQVPLNKPFQLMGGPMDFPGDGNGPASESVNCRCTMMLVDSGDSLSSLPTGDRQLGQDTEGFRDGVAEAASAEEEAGGLSEVDAEIAAETDADTGEVFAEADAATDEPAVDEPAVEEPAAEEPEAAEEVDIPEGEAQHPAIPAGQDATADTTTAGTETTTTDAVDTTTAGLDPEGAPYRLTYDYLSGLTEDQLDALTDRVVTGLAEDNPLEGARWDDLSTYLDTTERADTLASELGGQGLSDDRITAEIDKFLDANGRPGLTHPDVGGRPPAATVTRAQAQDEYAAFLEEQYVRAQAATRGHLLTPAAQARGMSGRELFGGNSKRAAKYASEELLEFWETEPRVTWSEFYYQRTGRYAGGGARTTSLPMDRDRTALRAAATAAEPTAAQVGAYQAGRAAHDAGDPSTTCPFDLTDDPDGLGLLWIRGYVYARRDALGAAAVTAGLLDNSWRLVGPRQVTGGSVTAAPASTPDDGNAAGSGPGAPHPRPEGNTPMPRTWKSDPFLAPFAVPTGDGRIFAVGSLTARALPLPLLYQDSSAPGHDQSVVVGRITDVQFTDTGIVASGDYLDDPSVADVVSKAIALVEAGLGGVSVDLAACTGELVDTDGQPVTMEAIFEAWDNGEDPQVLEQVTAGELIAVTQVATPAFAGAKIAMSDSGASDPGIPAPAPAAGEQTAAAEGDAATVEFVGMKDAKGEPLYAGSIVEVTLDANGHPVDPTKDADPAAAPAGQASPGQEAAAPPVPPAPTDAPVTKPDDATTTKVKGRVTNIDAKVEKITVQPEDQTQEPLVVDPQYVVCLDGGDAPEAAKPAAPATPAPAAAAVQGAQVFADPATPPAKAPAKDPKATPIPGAADAPADPETQDEADQAGDPDDVQPVTADGDLALLQAVAPHYGEAAKLVTAAFAAIKDDRLKTIAADLVEDAAEWRALLDYGLTPDDDDALAAAALVAGAGPMQPPAAWFENPNLTQPTAITVTDDGRVYGHAAVWGTCHVGYSKTCITPPPSPSSYAYFHTGEVVTADGSRVAVGNLTLGGRHASVEAGYRSAIEHYDVQGAGVAVVRMYEDEHGIAFSGSLTPGVTAQQVYDLRRSPVSGDWRRVGGNLEMIGCLSVNAPGFPTPRFRTDEAGRTALTAAPSVRPTTTGTPLRAARGGKYLSAGQLTAAIQSQISKEVAAELGRQRAAEQRTKRLQLATIAVKGDPRARMAALSASVDGGRSQARRDRVAELAGMVTA